MKAQRKALLEELLQTLAPHLTSGLPANQKLGKGLQKTIHQLADQLLRARMKQQKRAAQAVSNTSIVTQQLTETLTTALDNELNSPEYAGGKATRTIAESAELLAGKLVKIKRKYEKKDLQTDVPTDGASAAPANYSQRPVARAKRPSRKAPPKNATAGE